MRPQFNESASATAIMVTPRELQRFNVYRQQLLAAIDRELEEGGGGKSYEGAVTIGFPSLFDTTISMIVHCYVLGPTRHSHYDGVSLDECLDKAESDLIQWTAHRP